MSLAGSLVLENFNYGVSEAELPLFTDGEPLMDEETDEQKKINVKILAIEALSGVVVEIRVATDEWDQFVGELEKTKTTAVADDSEDD